MRLCVYCREDIDGYIVPFGKNADVYWQKPNKLVLRIGKELRECKINFCPMCGRELREPPKEET